MSLVTNSVSHGNVAVGIAFNPDEEISTSSLNTTAWKCHAYPNMNESKGLTSFLSSIQGKKNNRCRLMTRVKTPSHQKPLLPSPPMLVHPLLPPKPTRKMWMLVRPGRPAALWKSSLQVTHLLWETKPNGPKGAPTCCQQVWGQKYVRQNNYQSWKEMCQQVLCHLRK